MKFNLFIIFLLSFSNIFSQSFFNARVWCFGIGNKIEFNDSLNFSNSQINSDESSSSICDANGNLLIYTNGNSVYNKYDKIIRNGNDVGFKLSNNTTTSKMGSILITHYDNKDSFVYLFNTDYEGGSNGLVYSKISTYSNNDSGEVIISKKKLIGPVNESISAVNHSNGRDIWIVCHSFGDDFFYAFLLTKNGISLCPIVSKIGLSHCKSGISCAQVAMKFSPNGEKIATQSFAFNTTQVFQFDATNGVIHNNIYNYSGHISYTFEFSKNSNVIYLNKSNLGIDKVNLINKQIVGANSELKSVTGIQIAIDGNIYICKYPTKDLFVIRNTENENDSIQIFKLNNKLINNGLTLPSFNQSYFFTPAINYNYEMNCIKNSIQFWGKDTFGANVHTWQVRKLAVGNWQLGGSNKNINYTFADTGTYEVRYIASNGNKVDTVVKSIVLYDKIKQDFLGKDTTYVQGDVINKTLFAPTPNHCVRWWYSKDLTPALSKGEGVNLVADSVGTYICKVTNQAFCEVWDTIVISECINNLNQPSLFRSRDTLRTWHLNADSFVWYRNNQIYKITKQPFLALTDTGNYRVEAAKKGHCNRGSVGQILVSKLNVNVIGIENLGIRVFPNPSSGLVKIEGEVGFSLEIRDVLGRVIEQLKYEDQNSSPLLGRGVRSEVFLPKGIYFFHFDVGAYRSVEKVVVY